jgi:hypothetical protein
MGTLSHGRIGEDPLTAWIEEPLPWDSSVTAQHVVNRLISRLYKKNRESGSHFAEEVPSPLLCQGLASVERLSM